MPGVGVGFGKQEARIAGVGKGDPLFGAVEAVCIAVQARGRFHRSRRIRSTARLRESEHADLAPGNEVGHEALHLLRGAPVIDGERTGHGLHVHGITEFRRQARYLLGDRRHGQVSHVAAAKLFGKGGAEETGGAHLLDDRVGELLALFVIVDGRQYLGLGELAHALRGGGAFIG